MDVLQQSLIAYKQALLAGQEGNKFSEHTFRSALENLFNALKPSFIRIIHEPKSEEMQGNIRPDFKVFKQIDWQEKLSYPSLVGFIECKKWRENLELHANSKQIDKYLSVSPNILLTNYNRFMLISFDKILYDITLFPFDVDNNLFSDTDSISQDILHSLSQMLNDFFNATQAYITTKQELVKVLSTQAFYLGIKAREAYQHELHTSYHKFFEKTYESLREMVNYHFELNEFCDILGQSVVYGLLVAHLEQGNDNADFAEVNIESIPTMLPKEFVLLSEFIYFTIPSFSIPDTIAYTINNIKKAIALIDKASIAQALNTQVESISIYLYEDFLKAFDELRGSEKRKEGGVFYTPEPIVDFIVTALDSILKMRFDKPKGFAQEHVKVLDFATGTGSFLAKVFEKILEGESSKVWQNEVIKDKFLKDIYGFELSFVPYIVAHLKLRAILANAGFKLQGEVHKLQIFLTNTLDLSHELGLLSMPLFILEEQEQKAKMIKHSEDLLVIMGNPPYNQKSKNNLKDILQILDKYKLGLSEKNIQPLSNDYIKFIRFAEWKLTEQRNKGNKQGAMGFISANSFIWGRIHRKMRESLYKNFDEIYILNLHGDNEKDPKNDENVFDIRVGVCISIFIKHQNANKEQKGLYYYSTLENGILKRKDKFALLNEAKIKGLESIKWQKLKAEAPYFWFISRNLDEDYESFWSVAQDSDMNDDRGIFNIVSSGIKTQKDNITIQLSKARIEAIVKDFESLDIESIRQKYNLTEPRDWKIKSAKDCIQRQQGAIAPIAYRPFDVQYTYYHSGSKGFLGYPRYEVMQHFIQKENLGLCFTKDWQTTFNYDGVLISNLPTDIHYNGGQSYIAPLYCYTDSAKGKKELNFTKAFKDYIKSHKVLKHKDEKQILAFIYANLYNPHYRAKYAENLKIGFPRTNFEVSKDIFDKLESIGAQLISLHLMQYIPLDSSIELDYRANVETSEPSFMIEKIANRLESSNILLNKDLRIKGISQDIWDYKIGGYRVIDKFLSYRVGYVMPRAEIEHLVNMCKVIKATIALQKELKMLESSQ